MNGWASSNYGLELFTSIEEKMAKSRRWKDLRSVFMFEERD